MIKKETNKNGLVELLRFLCSLWVAYFHGFSPILSDKFNGENISTDFFFMLSGLFFLQAIEKYRDKPISEGIKFVVWGRTKKFFVPLMIAALSILFCNIAFELEFNGFNWPLSFLWFFAAQFIFLSVYYLIYRKVKSITTFNIVCIIAICIGMSFVIIDVKQFDRVVRSPAMLALGMLISQIPKIKINLKDEKKAKNMTLVINILGFAISLIALLYFAYLPGQAVWRRHLMACLLCPAVLYFVTTIPVRSKLMNLLGELSIFVYLAQCPILIHHYTVSRDTRDQFPVFCVCIIGMFLINRFVNKKKLIT